MICPKCKIEQHCPCKNCRPRNRDKITWVWDDSGELISCGGCGLTAHADWWLDVEAEQLGENNEIVATA